MKRALAPILISLALVSGVLGVALAKNHSEKVHYHEAHEHIAEDAPYTPEQVAELREYYRNQPNVFACVEDDGSATIVAVTPVSPEQQAAAQANQSQTAPVAPATASNNSAHNPGGLPCKDPL